MGRHELLDGTYANGDPRNPNRAVHLNDGQRPFWLQDAGDCRCTYAIGVEHHEAERGDVASVVWLDPHTGYCRFAQFSSPADALDRLQELFNPCTRLAVIWDERPPDPDTPATELELLLTKASAPGFQFWRYSDQA
jgi:hypothetical protein